MMFNLFAYLCLLAIAANASSKINVSCIGNSITEGSMGGAYPTYLQTLLGSGYQVENDGTSGTTLLKKGDKPYWTQGKLRQALSFKPDIVTIKLGTNDTKSQNWDTYGGDFKKDYLSMIDTLGTLTTKPEIFLVLPVPVFKTAYGIRDSIIKKIIVIINEIGVERGLPVIDANSPLLGFGGYFSDGVHPNAAGADTIAHVIYRAIMAATSIGSIEPIGLMPTAEYWQTEYSGQVETGNSVMAPTLFFDLHGRPLNPSVTAGGKTASVLLLRSTFRGVEPVRVRCLP